MLEGGFDEEGRFIPVPLSGLQQMTEVFRRRLIWLLVKKELLSEEFARNLLSWKNSGFSIDNSVRLTDAKSQESLAEYIARPPLTLKKIRYEPFEARAGGDHLAERAGREVDVVGVVVDVAHVHQDRFCAAAEMSRSVTPRDSPA